MIGEQRPPCIAVVGPEAEASRWAAALRYAGAWAWPMDFAAALGDASVAAVALCGGPVDVPTIKRALAAGKHLLVCDGAPSSADALSALDVLARRRGRVLTFAGGVAPFAGFGFVERMLSGARPMWRARYLRSLRCMPGAPSLDELAVAELAMMRGVVKGEPRAVSAAAPSGDASVAVITLHFDGGALALIEVSTEEARPRHEVSIMCDGRTLVLDAYSALAPLRVIGQASPAVDDRVAQPPPAVQSPEPAHAFGEFADARAIVADAFVRAASARDAAAGNAGALADAAGLWESARRSITSGGELVLLRPPRSVGAGRPALRLIQGGGRTVAAHPAPELTLVQATSVEAEGELQPIA